MLARLMLPLMLLPASATRPPTPQVYTGWAVEAYPELSAAEMEEMVRRMVVGGANVVWIGHNNPGEVRVDKVEPGLSFAVYEAYRNPADPRHDEAAAILQAQHRMLQACRTVGVRAVLPAGYQIQMGAEWNSRHPSELRLYASGQPLDIYGGGVSASFYSPSYREEIATYYRWVDAEFVRPYADVLLMLNLADEPIGGDYSPHAEAEFRRRSGLSFAEAQGDPQRQRLLGAFQSHYVVEYAAFSARLWQEIHPGLPVTMSFDGAQARATLTMPDVESLFRDTPQNLVITFDAYPHDGLPDVPVTAQELDELYLLVRSVGLYSARYGKTLWLWAASNSWGLSQASPDPGTVSDAVANGLALALLARQGGGRLEGVVFWNYNVKQQGLYNDTHRTAYDTETMFHRVSAAMSSIRRLMVGPPGTPEVLILAPARAAEEQIGAAREAVRLPVYPLDRLGILARTGANSALVGSLSGWHLEHVRTIAVLCPTDSCLSSADRTNLRSFLARGGRVVAPQALAETLAPGGGGTREVAYDGLVERRGNLDLAQGGIATLFDSAQQASLSAFWLEVLGVDGRAPGYRVVTDQVAFYYNLGPGSITIPLLFRFEGWGFRYDVDGKPLARIHGPFTTATLERREYALILAVPYRSPLAAVQTRCQGCAAPAMR
jgi:hypothetical protein